MRRDKSPGQEQGCEIAVYKREKSGRLFPVSESRAALHGRTRPFLPPCLCPAGGTRAGGIQRLGIQVLIAVHRAIGSIFAGNGFEMLSCTMEL